MMVQFKISLMVLASNRISTINTIHDEIIIQGDFYPE